MLLTYYNYHWTDHDDVTDYIITIIIELTTTMLLTYYNYHWTDHDDVTDIL